MRTRVLTTSLLLPITVLGAVAAAPDTATDCRDVDGANVCRTPTYLQCGSTDHLYAYAVDGMAQLSYDAPTAAAQEGGGCGEYDDPFVSTTTQDGPYSFDFSGPIDGNIDSFTVLLYNLDVGSGRAQDVTLKTRITIDGKSVFGAEVIEAVDGTPSDSPYRLPIAVTPEPTSTQAATIYRFTVTNVRDMVAAAVGGEDKTHTIIVTIDVSTDDGVADGNPPDYVGFNPWVWGASDAPSGVIFNELDDAPLGTVVQAKDYAAEAA